jgi:hypothetical protein
MSFTDSQDEFLSKMLSLQEASSECILKYTIRNKKKRSFQLSPILFKKDYYKKISPDLPNAASNSAFDFIDSGFKFRSRYLEDGLQIHLQISALSFRIALYIVSIPEKYWACSPGHYLHSSLEYGPPYAEYIKKARQCVFIKDTSMRLLSDFKIHLDELLTERFIPSINKDRKYSYDSFLNETYLLHFKEGTDDILYSLKEVQEEKVAIDLFSDAARDCLRTFPVQKLIDPSSLEIATWISDSSTFSEDDGKGVVNRTLIREKMIKGEKVDDFFSPTKDFCFSRTVIQVSPANTRDAWSANLRTLTSIKRLSYKLKQIVAALPYSAMADLQTVRRRKKILRTKSGKVFIMLDYKKCGLTVNRHLLSILADALYEQYKDEDFLLLKSFENLKVFDGDHQVLTKRGTGLGNCNEGITLLQCIVGHVLKRRFKTNSIFFNDDGVIETDLANHLGVFRFTCQFLMGIGMILNMKKSLISYSNCFCEDYIITEEEIIDYSKKQQLLLPYAMLFLQPEIWTAKRLYHSLDGHLIGTGLRNQLLLPCLGELYGYEFFKNELEIPYQLGGWRELSTSNFSSLIEYLLDPNLFHSNPNNLGPVPMVREWAWYLLSINETSRGLFSTAKIKYRGKVLENLFIKDFLFTNEGEIASFIRDYIGELTIPEYLTTLHDLINFRGLHNAKPKIRHGLIVKEQLNRYKLFNRFKSFRKFNSIKLGFGRSEFEMLRLMSQAKKIPSSPGKYTFPRCLVGVRDGKYHPSNKRAILVQSDEYSNTSSYINFQIRLDRTLEGLDQHRWLANSDPFIIRDLRARLTSDGYISDRYISIPEVNFLVPRCYQPFCPNKRLFCIDLATKLRQYPLSYKINCDLEKRTDIFTYADPVGYLFGRENSPFRLISQFKEYRNFISYIYSTRNLLSKKEAKLFFESIKHFLEKEAIDIEEAPDEEDFYTEVAGVENLYNDYLDNQIIGEITIEDLINKDAQELFASFSDEDIKETPGEDLEILDTYIEDEDEFSINEYRDVP